MTGDGRLEWAQGMTALHLQLTERMLRVKIMAISMRKKGMKAIIITFRRHSRGEAATRFVFRNGPGHTVIDDLVNVATLFIIIKAS